MSCRLAKFLVPVVLVVGWFCFASFGKGVPGGQLVLYCGRSKALVKPLLDQFKAETGVQVQVRYAKTAQLAVALVEEGQQSRADLFWAQDAGSLGVLSKSGLMASLNPEIVDSIPPQFRNRGGQWVATSGRARVLAFAPLRVSREELPQRLEELADPKWKGRVGWAPTNASFQAVVTAMRNSWGEDRTRKWLAAMKINGTRSYAKNTPILKALAAGEIDLGLPNHYYLLRFKANDDQFPVEQQFFVPGDIGNLVNVAGIGVVKYSSNQELAMEFIRFLLSARAQQYFSKQVFEYPVIDGVESSSQLVSHERLLELAPSVKLDELSDVADTIAMLKEVGLL